MKTNTRIVLTVLWALGWSLIAGVFLGRVGMVSGVMSLTLAIPITITTTRLYQILK